MQRILNILCIVLGAILFAACASQPPVPPTPAPLPPAPTTAPQPTTAVPPTPAPLAPTTVPPPITATAQPNPTMPIVKIESGQLQGEMDGAIHVFKGIPFAAAPVGELRWVNPQPAPAWEGVRQATTFGADCLQPEATIQGAGSNLPQAEDCLYMNIWTPNADASAKLPVMFWIHGGALVIGSGASPSYNGTPLAARGAVVVTFNYRLGHLGFFSHPALDKASPGGTVNFGLLDEIAALKWAQKNIAQFGGDPNNVMIFGESAGAQSVLTLMASPLAQGLFHKAAVESSYGIPSNTRAKALEAGVKVAAALGLDGANATLEQLRAVPAAEFTPLNQTGLTLMPVFVTGDAAVPEPVLDVFQKGKEAAVPMIIGNNSDEASVAIAFGINPATLIEKMGLLKIAVKPLYPGVTDNSDLGRQLIRDLVFTSFAKRMADLHSAQAPSWRYYFSYLPEAQRFLEPGVPHGGEIVFVFDTLSNSPESQKIATPADDEMAKKVSAYWFEFARTGKPAVTGEPEWLQADSKNDQTLEFGDTITMQSNLMRTRLNVFIGILNIVGKLIGRE